MFRRSNQSLFSSWWWRVDRLNLVLVFILIFFGLICVTTSSFGVAKKIDIYLLYFIRKHFVFAAFSVATMILVSFLDREYIKKYSGPAFIFCLGLLVLTYFFGDEIKGSRRWFHIWFLSVQPSEFAKVAFVVWNSKLLSYLDVGSPIKIYSVSAIACLVILALVAIEPDVGMSCLIFLTWCCQIFCSGVNLLLMLVPITMFLIGLGMAYFMLEHVRLRVDNFMNGTEELYQVKKSIAAFANGGFFGVGPGQGQIKLQLPDSHTDFIFSVIGEEFGVISCLALMLIYLLIGSRSLTYTLRERDLFSICLVCGLISQFVAQAMINIGVNIRLLPAKGMTLPFISYGGSSMLAAALTLGLVLAINKKKYGLESVQNIGF